MIRKPTSGDSEQRDRDSARSRRQSELHAGASDTRSTRESTTDQGDGSRNRPAHGSAEGESAHGALPRDGIEFEQGD